MMMTSDDPFEIADGVYVREKLLCGKPLCRARRPQTATVFGSTRLRAMGMQASSEGTVGNQVLAILIGIR